MGIFIPARIEALDTQADVVAAVNLAGAVKSTTYCRNEGSTNYLITIHILVGQASEGVQCCRRRARGESFWATGGGYCTVASWPKRSLQKVNGRAVVYSTYIDCSLSQKKHIYSFPLLSDKCVQKPSPTAALLMKLFDGCMTTNTFGLRRRSAAKSTDRRIKKK
jgi:hypothetical protein